MENEYMADNASVTEDVGAAADNGMQTESADSLTQTQAFSKRLNEMTERGVNDFVSGLGLVNEFDGTPIRTRAEYDRYRKMQTAEFEGKDPNTAVEIADMREKLNVYEKSEQDRALQADPDLGEIYSSVRDDVLELVDYCHSHGDTSVTVDSAFQVILRKNAGKIFKDIKAKSSSDAISKTNAMAKASPGKLSSGDIPNATDYGSMSDAEFEKQIARAKRGALMSH